MRINPEQIESLELDDEFDFETMFNESEKANGRGRIQNGVIVRIDNEYAMIAVGGAKQEGRLPIAEIQDLSGNLLFKVGDQIEIYVSNNQERLNISYKRVEKLKKLEQKINEIKNNFEGMVVDCRIIRKNKGGYIVEFDEIEAFLPKRESALKDDGKNIGKQIRAMIIGINEEEKTIVVSRKKYLDEIEKNREENVQKLLQDKTKIYEGIVTKTTSFGLFVEVEGVEGLVHYTEISYNGPVNPVVVAQVGEKVQVKVLGFNAEKKRLSFSIKATMEDPWLEIQDKLEVGDTIRVVASKIENYGVFVDLGNGTEGFLHISEISWDKQLRHPSDVIVQGQELDVEIIEIDAEQRRLRVSLKKMLPKPFAEFTKKVKVGDVVEGKVVKVMDFGVFVNIGEVDGLLHNEDYSWDKNQKASSLKVGDLVKVKVIKIDEEKEKLSLSTKALEESPLDRFLQKHNIDSIVKGKIVDIKDFGIFISLGEVEALIRDEDLQPLKKEELQVGTEVEGVIAHIDRQHSRVRVSIKRLDRIKEREQLNQYNSDTKMTLGDILKRRN
ncbi:30S ribosomal protein S1 [Helicobacter kayseriensis]|uniref:30S ribosomal protein S1 n=1 Tax=Helicobacter kayseriensis TaxID=2905877 RepID=UPI001E3E09C3|nr:30S ribosomal protein S1 [Helicobacter kayseriensis]MCE3047718.1 30S ribosomal protein S1 [Helicobacter kayseriensis]MCE3049044.1 30S ribosomal protein S1 [Helicobacter kayseriensis]